MLDLEIAAVENSIVRIWDAGFGSQVVSAVGKCVSRLFTKHLVTKYVDVRSEVNLGFRTNLSKLWLCVPSDSSETYIHFVYLDVWDY